MNDDREFSAQVCHEHDDLPDAAVNATAFTESGEEIVRAVREAVEEVVGE